MFNILSFFYSMVYFNSLQILGLEKNCTEKSFIIILFTNKRPLGRLKHGWKANTKMNLSEIGHEGVDWIHVGQGRNHCCATVKCCSEPLNSIKGSLTD
jgi:hypothetical protein